MKYNYSFIKEQIKIKLKVKILYKRIQSFTGLCKAFCLTNYSRNIFYVKKYILVLNIILISGPICGADSCCPVDLERNLVEDSRKQLSKFVRESSAKVSSLLETRAKKFDDFFRDMMVKSKKEFHEMFKKTYGINYLKNSRVFMDLFAELELYYNKGNVKLSETMDNFFSLLYQRMFTVINAQYQFDDKYLGCVAEHMVELNPFGDVPHKLSMQLKRSFVATRTFYKALSQGAIVAQNMLKLKFSHECGQELTRMEYCGSCKGLGGAGACFKYCKTILSDCLRVHSQLNRQWDDFVGEF